MTGWRLVEHFAATRGKGRPSVLTPNDEALIVARYRRDRRRWHLHALALEHGCDRAVVRRALQRYGVEVDSTPGPRSNASGR